MKIRTLALAIAAIAALPGSVAAQVDFGSSKLGDMAPELNVEVLKGDPVNLRDGLGKNVFIVEFWATWCGPCKFTIPHLTDLQKKYRDDGLVVIGISDETAAAVMPYVEKMGDKMEYTVAVDRANSTKSRYLGGYGEDAIPRAFVIDVNGRVVWFGNPLKPFMDEIVATLLQDIPKDAEAYTRKGASTKPNDSDAGQKDDAESQEDR